MSILLWLQPLSANDDLYGETGATVANLGTDPTCPHHENSSGEQVKEAATLANAQSTTFVPTVPTVPTKNSHPEKRAEGVEWLLAASDLDDDDDDPPEWGNVPTWQRRQLRQRAGFIRREKQRRLRLAYMGWPLPVESIMTSDTCPSAIHW